MNTPHRLSRLSAISLVIANMIGTGVFTSLGFQLMGIKSPIAIMALWLIGGLIALCGALVYGELGAAMPRSGGEYHYLSKLYHPLLGFLAGWVSALVGFSAPVAMTAVALGSYVHAVYPTIDTIAIAIAIVIIITAIHCTDLKKGSRFQNVFTVAKVIIIILFILSGLFFATPVVLNLSLDTPAVNDIFSRSFAVSLIFVSYAYSGWNSAAYIAGELKNPQKDLPKALLYGTLLVMVLYVLLNFVFLYTAPIPELVGKIDIGHVSAIHIFGAEGGALVSLIIAVLLISSISSMILAGPRVCSVIGEDYKVMGIFAIQNKHGVPVYATILQGLISLFIIYSGTFENIFIYIGFTLNLFTFLTILGIYVFRLRFPDEPRPYKTWGYPITPFIFLVFTGATLVFALTEHFEPSAKGLLTIVAGIVVYFINDKFIKKS